MDQDAANTNTNGDGRLERSLVLGTAGHIDHGKTALVRALTGVDTDRLPQEKERGMTIDLGFAHIDLPSGRLGLIDVPGHDRFVRNMLAGATGIDLAMLVIAADDSVKPQTREHLAILNMLGVRRGLIVLTKIDRAEADWIELVEDEVRSLVSDTFLADAPIVRTSAVSGEGIDALRSTLDDLCEEARAADDGDRPFRLAIDRSFVLKGLGTVVTGTVASGRAAVGDALELQPGGRSVVIRALHSHGQSVESVERGQRAAINIPSIHHSEIHRGESLAVPSYVRAVRRITVSLECLDDALHAIRDRSAVQLHVGTSEVEASVRLLDCASIEPGGRGLAQLICREPVAVVVGLPLVIRMQSPRLTLGGGKVISTCTPGIRRQDDSTIQRLSALSDAPPAARVLAAIHEIGLRPWTDLDVCAEADVDPRDVEQLRASLVSDGSLTDLSALVGRPQWVATQAWDQAQSRIARALERLHDTDPMAFGFEQSRVRRTMRGMADDLFDGLIRSMLKSKKLGGSPRIFGLADRQPRLTKKQMALRDAVLQAFRDASFSPPTAAELRGLLGVQQNDVQAILDYCVADGSLVHVGESLFLIPESVAELEHRVRSALADRGALTMAELRDLCETTRKYAVVYGGYLDRAGVTRRDGDVRVLANG